MKSDLLNQEGKMRLDEPLAFRLRPTVLEDFFGQEEIVGEGKLLRQLIAEDNLHSVIFYGPPGCGKTTLAYIIANESSAEFEVMSAVTGGVPELRKVVAAAKERKLMGRRTVLFVDEIHRFSKSQQDALLPHVEDGTVILIGATTENPSFEVISALLSRSQVFVFKALGEEALLKVLQRALLKASEIMGNHRVSLDEESQKFLVSFANGDARSLLNNLEIVLKLAKKETLAIQDVQQILQRKNLRYDKKGEEHYNIISALHKSMRGSDPDGALYWLGRMLEGGEDPLYVARRLIRFASEDVGMADPHALLVAVAAKDACHFVGMPECSVNLAQVVVHLSMAPKSNALYAAYGAVQSDINKYGNLEVPLHIRNAPTKLMKEWGYGKGYKYAHDFADAKVDQEHLPDQLKGRTYYEPTDRGLESKIKEKLDLKRKA
ncbi:MAG TPA: replication-associated recombination protein A [Candidatus Gracilibacteria bacterium]|nr:replication-associated recombination protein A [Candidatus Gracilibacteria bacterium]